MKKLILVFLCTLSLATQCSMKEATISEKLKPKLGATLQLMGNTSAIGFYGSWAYVGYSAATALALGSAATILPLALAAPFIIKHTHNAHENYSVLKQLKQQVEKA